jgi:hypothetical protein
VESEREKPEREEELPSKKEVEPAPLASRPRPGMTRCPYCHDTCPAEGEVCVCAECLSRHHVRCWDEGKGCSSCRGTRRLEAAAAKPGADAALYGPVIDAWLKLALVYNAGLALITILGLGSRLLDPATDIEVFGGAILANFCFLLGPAVEIVARRLGYRGATLRWVLFALGFALAAGLALLQVMP